MSAKKTIQCPICGTATEFFSEPLGPFCSDRCKLVDLGKWLGEEYIIPGELRPEHFAEYEQLSSETDLDRSEDR